MIATDPLGVTPPAADHLHRLHRRLARRAAAADLLDVSYRLVDSPHGPLLVAATAAGVVRVAFHSEDHDAVLDALAMAVSPRVLRDTARTAAAARQLDQYFAGRRRQFDLPVDLRLARGFRRSVVETLPLIAYGSTASYADVAALVGNPGAVRAVGSACAHNPVPIVVPCHRVVHTDGSPGQYRGGAAMKAALLALEAR
ncbi:MAG: methylated-DNA--[protein]-cysteine S-methyltransferase [Ilumatobacteraceae bacterium]